MATDSPSRTFEYNSQTVHRAKVALSCAPFRLKLFQEMRHQSVPIQQIASERGVKLGYVKTAYSEATIEDKLVWLINVGLLRREVDGQGLTDSFRLTPLGRKIIAEWEQSTAEIPGATLANRLDHWLFHIRSILG